MQAVREIDDRAVTASYDETEFERLLLEFKPFLYSSVSKLSGNSYDMHKDMMSVARQAFYESIKNYNCQKGNFIQFMKMTVHSRLTDCLRKIYKNRVELTILDSLNEDGQSQTSILDKISIEEYHEETKRINYALEIESLKDELAKWGLTMELLLKHSPKHAKLRDEYRSIVKEILNDTEILNIIFEKRYLPVKKISEKTKIPVKKIERGRIFILSSLIIYNGDYELIKQYVA